MHTYLVIPLMAAMGLAAAGGTCLLMGAELHANRSGAVWLLLGAWWAGCEVLWNSAGSADAALLLHRIAAPGFVFIGPLAMQFVLDIAEAPPPILRRLLPAAYLLGGASLVLAWTTPWMLAAMHPTAWGWALVPGPAFGVWAGGTGVAVVLALGCYVRDYRASTTQVSRRQGPRVAALVAPVAVAGLTTDVLLPLVHVQVPRVGSLALALVGATAVWALARYGFSRLHPHAFSGRILQTLPDGIALTTLHGRIRIGNEKLAELLGCSVDDVVGRQIGDHLELRLVDPPREQREVECELRPIRGAPIPVCVSTAPIADVHGFAGVVLAIQDLREVAALRNRLIVSGRLVAVGQLAAGIAHEINNPLAFVRSNLGVLRRDWERFESESSKSLGGLPSPLDDWADLLDECLEGVDRAAHIVRDVREFSHAGSVERDTVDLNELIDQVIRVAAPQLGPDVRVATDYGRMTPLLCEPQRLKQVFLNLVVNAGQAISGAGRIRIQTRDEIDKVHVVVEDDGCGMPPEIRERIFDPFFTTKSVGTGTGLGLSIAFEIVKSHGGEIWCQSAEGAGTAIHVRLPHQS